MLVRDESAMWKEPWGWELKTLLFSSPPYYSSLLFVSFLSNMVSSSIFPPPLISDDVDVDVDVDVTIFFSFFFGNYLFLLIGSKGK